MVHKVALKDNCNKVNTSVSTSINEYTLLSLGHAEHRLKFSYGWLLGINLRIKRAPLSPHAEFTDYVL